MSTFARVVVAVLAIVGARGAAAHSMDYALRGSGEVRIVFRYASGPPMIGATYRVFAPGAEAPVANGTTDSAGEVGFRATQDGQWRVEASDSTGQAIRARIDVTNGVPAVASRKIPDWLAAVSLALNILLVAAYALMLRSRRWSRGVAASRTEPPRQPATSPHS